MIVIGITVALALFLLVGWIVATEMFQQRGWRRRVASGDHAIVAALILEAMAAWRRARPPRDVPPALWAGVQRAELVAADAEAATVQSSAEGAFRSVDGRREQVASALDEAVPLAARLAEMLLYDVPNLSLGSVRVDVYATFAADGGAVTQRPILTTTASRREADAIDWDGLDPAEILARLDTAYEPPDANGAPVPIALPPPLGQPVAPDDAGARPIAPESP